MIKPPSPTQLMGAVLGSGGSVWGAGSTAPLRALRAGVVVGVWCSGSPSAAVHPECPAKVGKHPLAYQLPQGGVSHSSKRFT